MNYAPVAIFVYKRPEHTRRTIESLQKNKESSQTKLYVLSDAPKSENDRNDVEEVRTYIRTIKGFSEVIIIEREENFGLAKSITTGVTDLLRQNDSIIVIEDDLLLSPYFLRYMNDGLRIYKDDENVASIHGYIYPTKHKLPETFFLKGADCWTWATWPRAWKYYRSDSDNLLAELEERSLIDRFNFEGSYDFVRLLKNHQQGKVQSWAVLWYASAFLKDMYTLYPRGSLINNIGFGGDGATHTNHDLSQLYTVPYEKTPIKVERIPIEEHEEAREIVKEALNNLKLSFWKKVKISLRTLFK